MTKTDAEDGKKLLQANFPNATVWVSDRTNGDWGVDIVSSDRQTHVELVAGPVSFEVIITLNPLFRKDW